MFLREIGQFARKLQAIEGMDRIKQLDSLLCLVCLQGTKQMQFYM